MDVFVYDPLANDCAVGTRFSKIVGICGWALSHRKIWPRSTTDVVAW